ncbi:MAG: hypothetical protein ACFFG0_18550 [Candidatus Thorarchaeota archaeon]
MHLNGKNYKSLNFTLMEDKLMNGSKIQTFRTGFIPNYEIKDIIAIRFKKEFRFLAKVLDLYPNQIKSLTPKEAKQDGFSSVKEFQEGIMKLNNIKSMNHWGFITVFEKIKNMQDYL